MLRLFRPRTVWLPTVFGLLLALALAAAVATAFALWIGGFLAQNAAARGADGRGARTLVVEGWLGTRELDAAARAFRERGYGRLLVSGGPIDDWPDGQAFTSYADRAAAYLRHKGLGEGVVVAVPAPASAQDRTYLSAVMVRMWFEQHGSAPGAIDLFTQGVHARRSRMVYRLAFGPNAEIGVLAAPPRDHDVDRWWRTSAGAKAVLGETISVLWTQCCFWPAPRGSFAERWAIPEPGA